MILADFEDGAGVQAAGRDGADHTRTDDAAGSSDNDAVRPRRRTLGEELRLQIADDIMAGKLEPGASLDELGLAERYKVSRTPVREALRQLASSGLVEIRPHRGAVVTRISPDLLLELFVAMAELEALCAGLAAIAMTARERRALEQIHSRLAELVRTGDPQSYHEVNETFHTAIYEGTHNSYIAELTKATRVRLQPFRRAQFRAVGRLAKSFQEHDRVVQAVLRGDRDGAARAMRDHIGIVKEAFEAYMQGG